MSNKFSLKGLKQGLLQLNSHDKYLKYIWLKKCSNLRIPKKLHAKLLLNLLGRPSILFIAA